MGTNDWVKKTKIGLENYPRVELGVARPQDLWNQGPSDPSLPLLGLYSQHRAALSGRNSGS